MTDPKTPQEKPKSFDAAFNKLDEIAEGTADDPKKPDTVPAEQDNILDEADNDPLSMAADKERDPDAVPPWIKFPEDTKWKIPPHKQIYFLRFKAAWTDNPTLGDRTIIFWALTDTEEKLASKRTRGDSGRTITELTKSAIRAMGAVAPGSDDPAIPMAMADWTGKLGPGNVDRFWNEIGSKCRTLVQNIYLRTHSLTVEETADFFLNCLAVRSAVAG